LRLVIPQLAIGERTLSIARNWLVPAREKADFEFLAAKSIWSAKPLKTLLQHAHLANYNRELVNWKVDDSIYQQFVLSPEIDPTFDGEINWRRPLWEHFYPRIRKEGSVETAAENVLRELRNRAKFAETGGYPETIAEMWESGKASPRGFEVLSVAALRSVGIPARLSFTGKAEFWNGAEWKGCSSFAALPAVR
jgi:transglutaminase-like putative cysteine protease